MVEGIPGVEVCPDCGGDLESGSPDGDRPAQTITRHCRDCLEAVRLGLCWYPDESYVVVGDRTGERDCTECGQETTAVSIDTRSQIPEHVCEGCLPGHLCTVLEKTR